MSGLHPSAPSRGQYLSRENFLNMRLTCSRSKASTPSDWWEEEEEWMEGGPKEQRSWLSSAKGRGPQDPGAGAGGAEKAPQTCWGALGRSGEAPHVRELGEGQPQPGP